MRKGAERCGKAAWRWRKTAAFLAVLAVGCGGDRYEVRGLVLKVDPAAGSITVSHDPVPGLMDAMVMPFGALDRAELKGINPGDRIQFRLRVDASSSVIDRVRVLSAGATGAMGSAPGTASGVAIGTLVPDFSLVDQHGGRVALSGLRGRVVVASFIYTRCPLPDYCPRVMTTMAALRDRFRERLGHDLVLLTITFDPRHDTPETLTAYADRYGANVAGWHLLTGDPVEIARVCALFGVEFWPDEGMISHSLQTVVIDRDGRLAAIAEGKEWSARQLADLVGSRF